MSAGRCEVARLARDGNVVEIEAGDYHHDVAIWEQARLTISGVGGAARLLAGGRNAEGKAIWVIRNGDFDVANIDFIGTRASDMNGAGIRFEGGRLRLRRCLFWNNQMGLVSSNDSPGPRSELIIEDSEFAYSHVDGKHWGHNLYVDSMRALTITGSYFHRAGIGHLLTVANDVRADWEDLRMPARQDYRLARSTATTAYQPLGDTLQGRRLVPDAQYVHPHTTRRLSSAPSLVGALQDQPP